MQFRGLKVSDDLLLLTLIIIFFIYFDRVAGEIIYLIRVNFLSALVKKCIYRNCLRFPRSKMFDYRGLSLPPSPPIPPRG